VGFIYLVIVLVFLAGFLSMLVPLKGIGIKSRKQGLGIALASFIAFVMLAQYVPPPSTDTPDASVQLDAPDVDQTTSSAISAAPPPKKKPLSEMALDAMPEGQKRFIAAIESGRAAFRAGRNEMAQGASRPARATDICSAIKDARASNWIGQIAKLSSNSDGLGVLQIRIAPDVHIETWGNALSDYGDNTLISPKSPVFAAAVQMENGQWVTFSGTFVRSSTDCVRERSLTIRGSMTEPSFIMRFRSVSTFNPDS